MNSMFKKRYLGLKAGAVLFTAAIFLSFFSLLACPDMAFSGPVTPASIQNIKPVPLMADPGVNTYKVPPPDKFLMRDASEPLSATVTINYLPAGDGRFGDTCIAWPDEPKAAFTYAANIWGSLLTSSVPITIDACWCTNLGAGVLGHSATINFFRDYAEFPVGSTWYPSSLANKLHGSAVDPSNSDMYIAYSTSFPWYYGTDGNPGTNQYDFVSVVLHEIAHGLGFAGSMTVSSGIGSWGYNTGYPIAYDRFTQNGSGQSLLNTTLFPNPSSQLGAQLTGGNLYFNGTNANAANGGTPPKIYAPGSWAGGSSYSHLDYDTFVNTPNNLMVYAMSKGEARHSPGPVTSGLFEDIGWTTASPDDRTLTVTIGGNKKGTVNATGLSCSGTTCTGTYNDGDEVAITASPAKGSVLDEWVGCDSVGTTAVAASVCNVTMDSAKSVQAIFNTPPVIAVSPASVNFNNQVMERPTDKTITVKNNGVSHLIISDINLSGPNWNEFSGVSTGACDEPMSKGGTPCYITMTVSASTYGKKAAQLNIVSNDPKNPTKVVKLAANVAPPKITVSPTSANLSGKVGEPTTAKKITVKNTGTSDLTISGVGFKYGIFGFGLEDSCSGVTLAKNQSCLVYVDFTALGKGKVTDYLDISSNDPDPKKSPASVKLTGTGK
jgi:hypothetical protein